MAAKYRQDFAVVPVDINEYCLWEDKVRAGRVEVGAVVVTSAALSIRSVWPSQPGLALEVVSADRLAVC